MLKKKQSFTIAALVGLATVFIAAGIYAGTAVPETITMQNKAYEKHTKGIVEFSHKKHVAEYKAACGDCHHDDQGKPLTALKEGDNVESCITCHKIPGTVPGELKKEWRGNQSAQGRAGQARTGVPRRGGASKLHHLPQRFQQEKQHQGRTGDVHHLPSQAGLSARVASAARAAG